jgi:hypothetical protein
MLKHEKGKDVTNALMELDGGQQLFEVSLVAADQELHPLMGPNDGTHQEP